MFDNELERNRKSNFIINKIYHLIFSEKFTKKIDLFDRGHKYKVINLNKKFPDYILNNLKNLNEFIA